MKIQLKIDTDRITLDELIEMESGNMTARFMRDFLARFVTNGDGDYLAEEEARKIIGSMNLTQLKETSEQFVDSIQELQAAAIPPISGGG